MRTHITVDELGRMPADSIRELPKTVPVEADGKVVGFFIPARKYTDEQFRSVLARIDEEAAKRTPEETRRLENLLGEREPESRW